MTRMIKIDRMEDWVLEELAEKPNWSEIVGLDGYVLYCVSGPNEGTLVGNVDTVELTDDIIAMTTLFRE